MDYLKNAFRALDDVLDEEVNIKPVAKDIALGINELHILNEDTSSLGKLAALRHEDGYKNLHDNTIKIIARVYKDEMDVSTPVREIEPEVIKSFVDDCGGLAGFVIEFWQEIKFNSPIIDIACNSGDQRFMDVLRYVARKNYGMGKYDDYALTKPREFKDWEYADLVLDTFGEKNKAIVADNAKQVKDLYFSDKKDFNDIPTLTIEQAQEIIDKIKKGKHIDTALKDAAYDALNASGKTFNIEDEQEKEEIFDKEDEKGETSKVPEVAVESADMTTVKDKLEKNREPLQEALEEDKESLYVVYYGDDEKTAEQTEPMTYDKAMEMLDELTANYAYVDIGAAPTDDVEEFDDDKTEVKSDTAAEIDDKINRGVLPEKLEEDKEESGEGKSGYKKDIGDTKEYGPIDVKPGNKEQTEEGRKQIADNKESRNKKDEFEQIVDVEAENEEELQASYIGKDILMCTVCHTPIYKDPSEVIKTVRDGKTLYNIEEECPHCHSIEGFDLKGQIADPEGNTGDEEDLSKDPDLSADGLDDVLNDESGSESGAIDLNDNKLPEEDQSMPTLDNTPETEGEAKEESGKDEEPKKEESLKPVKTEMKKTIVEELDFSDIDDKGFNEAFNKYLSDKYENFKSFTITEGSISPKLNSIVLEGKLVNTDGEDNVRFILEAKESKDGTVKFTVVNEDYNINFEVEGKLNKDKLLESTQFPMEAKVEECGMKECDMKEDHDKEDLKPEVDKDKEVINEQDKIEEKLSDKILAWIHSRMGNKPAVATESKK